MSNRLPLKTAKENYILEGKTILLRQYTPADIERWYQWFNDEEVTRHMDQRRENTKDKQIEYLERMTESRTDIQLAIVCKKDNELIGTVGLHAIDDRNQNADISIIIGEKEYWGKGYAKETVSLIIRHAFTTLKLHKLTAGFIEGNKGSQALFAGLGFKPEARLKEHVLIAGEYKDIIKTALLQSETKRKN